MPKKKRAAHARGAVAAPVGAPAGSAASFASIAPSLTGIGDLAAEKQRARLALHDADAVIADIKTETQRLAPAQLERELWVHLAVAGLVEIALVLDNGLAARTAFFAVFPLLWAARSWLTRLSLSLNLSTANPLVTAASRRILARVNPLWLLLMERVFLAIIAAIGLAAASVAFRGELPVIQWTAIVVVLALTEVVQLRGMFHADGQQTAAAIVAATVEAFVLVHFFATFATNMSNLVVDHLARRLTAVTAATHTFVILGAIYAQEHATAYHRAEFQSDRQRSAALMTKLREAYRDPEDDNKEGETASKRRKRAARAKLAAAAASADSTDGMTADALLPAPPSRWRRPSVQLGLLLTLQTLLLTTLVVLVSTTVLAWEAMSILVLSSAGVAWRLLRLKQSLCVSGY